MNPAVLAPVVLSLVTTASNESGSVAPAMRRLSIDGAVVTYVEQGRGVPVVLVHGAFSDHRVWETQREAIARGHRYVAVDLRYHGPEPWPDAGSSYSAATHADDVAAVIRALGAGAVHLVGRSYGGLVALLVAMKHPELVRTLVLQEPSVGTMLTGPEAAAVREERDRSFGPIRAAVSGGDSVQAMRLLYDWVNNRGPGTFDRAPEGFRAMALENARTVPLLLRSQPAPVTCEQLAGMPPTLIINGEGDNRFYSLIGENLSRCIPGSRREVVAAATHDVSGQNPSRWREVALGFLAKHDR
jgi:pimeloyl-ACP methyl ester carboxylesterase